MSEQDSHNDRRVAELVLQLGRTAYADCASSGLTQAQWMALRFFARANRFSRTISGFADFHATTRGTASQTVKSLVEKEYLTRTPSDRDGRSSRFDLTERSTAKLSEDPLDDLVRAAGHMSHAQQEKTVDGLRQMLGLLSAQRERPVFGFCALCGNLDTDNNSTRFHCRLMNESLESDELEEICVRFNPALRDEVS
jgi:DNA-binding MarR family transcriptional regulator